MHRGMGRETGVRERTSFKSELGLLGKEPDLSEHTLLELKDARPQAKSMGESMGF